MRRMSSNVTRWLPLLIVLACTGRGLPVGPDAGGIEPEPRTGDAGSRDIPADLPGADLPAIDSPPAPDTGPDAPRVTDSRSLPDGSTGCGAPGEPCCPQHLCAAGGCCYAG